MSESRTKYLPKLEFTYFEIHVLHVTAIALIP